MASTPAQAAALALEAGLDVELPSVACYGAALAGTVRDGLVAEEFVDRAAARVLRQKCDLGLLDPGWPGREAVAADGANGTDAALDLDPSDHRALARRLAEESVVLLANRDAALPLRPHAKIAVTGPLADDPLAFYGCYSMPRHLGGRYPEAAEGPPSATVLAALRAKLPAAQIDYAVGCAVRDQDRSGFAHAAAHAREDEAHLPAYLDEFVFRFNRRRSRSRGLLFYRVLELAAGHEPVRFQSLLASKKPRPVPVARGWGHPPSLDRPEANRPWRNGELQLQLPIPLRLSEYPRAR